MLPPITLLDSELDFGISAKGIVRLGEMLLLLVTIKVATTGRQLCNLIDEDRRIPFFLHSECRWGIVSASSYNSEERNSQKKYILCNVPFV